MKHQDCIKMLGIGHSAFYKLLNRLGIKCEVRGELSDDDFKHIFDAFLKRKSTGMPTQYYRVIVNKGYGSEVVRAGLSQAKAIRAMREYRAQGYVSWCRGCKDNRLIR